MERREAARVSPPTVRNQLAAVGDDRHARSSVASSREFPSCEWTSRFNSRLAREKRLDAWFDRQTNPSGVVRWITSFARLVMGWWSRLARVHSRWESLVRAVSSAGHPSFARARAKPRELWDGSSSPDVVPRVSRAPAKSYRLGAWPVNERRDTQPAAACHLRQLMARRRDTPRAEGGNANPRTSRS